MSAHIIGRPNDDLLDIILGHGADPEQAFIRGSEEGDGFEQLSPGQEEAITVSGGLRCPGQPSTSR